MFYAVTASLPDEPLRDEYVAWLTGGHVQDVIAAGAIEARVVVLDPEPSEKVGVRVESLYMFPTRQALDAYIRDHAPRLRAEGVAKFGDRGVTFTRRIGPVVLALSTQLSTQGERV